MDCKECPRFDTNLNRCRDGKVNPQSYDHAFQVTQYMGLRAICVFNDYRERLVEARKGKNPAASVRLT